MCSRVWSLMSISGGHQDLLHKPAASSSARQTAPITGHLMSWTLQEIISLSTFTKAGCVAHLSCLSRHSTPYGHTLHKYLMFSATTSNISELRVYLYLLFFSSPKNSISCFFIRCRDVHILPPVVMLTERERRWTTSAKTGVEEALTGEHQRNCI